MKIKMDKRYIGNGTNEARKLAGFKMKSLKSQFGVGYTWHIIFEDGKIVDLLHISRGKDCFRKKDMEVSYK